MKPVVITFNERHYKSIDKDTKNGGSLLTSLLPALGKIASKTMPIIKKIAGPVTSGIASAIGSLGIEKIFGSGSNFHNSKVGDIVKALAIVQNELTKLSKKEKDKFDKVMMIGDGQSGGFLASVLGAIGIPMILKLLTGSGLHNTPKGGYKTHPKTIPIPKNQNQPIVKEPEGTSLKNYKWLPYEPQFDDHEIKGYGVKKKIKKNRGPGHSFRVQQPLQARAFIEHPVLNFKNTSTSNTYLKKWIDHMGIKNFAGVFAKDQITTHMIKRNHFYIINLDDIIGNGTHWTTYYCNNRNIIEYFDSYGLKPPKIINENYNYIYNSSQIQGYDSKACGYYCLFYIYYRSHGFTFYEIIKQFSLVDRDYNQNLIKDVFNNYK